MRKLISLFAAILLLTALPCAFAEENSKTVIDDSRMYMEYTGSVIRNETQDEYLIEFYAENKSSLDISLRTVFTEVNGVGVNGYLEDRISGMCRDYIYLHVLDTCMDMLTGGEDFCVAAELQAMSGTEKYSEMILDTVVSFDTGTSAPEMTEFVFDDLDGKLLNTKGKAADVRIEGIRWLEPYCMYEIYGFAKNNTEDTIYAYAHDITVAGTEMYDQGDFLIRGGKTGEVAAYITEDMLYMDPDEDAVISFSFDVIDDTVSCDEETGEYPPIDRAEFSLSYGDLLKSKEAAGE